ncbi:MAG: NAD(P)H-binding protein [Betaproteobacteria bacterium]|nr:NAD(P)H-binding protein [Betaproteobacteria bacterium]
MNVLLAGATGLVGSAYAAQWQGPGTLHLLVRRPVAASAPLQQVHVVDFAALPALPPADAAVCALGTTIAVAGSQAAFRAVDFDAVLAFARAARAAGARKLAVVSSLGADRRSSSFYSRTKGEMEVAVAGLGYDSVIVARPSLLTGDRGALAQPARVGERLAQWLAAPLAPLIPRAYRPIPAATVARALHRALLQAEPGLRIFDSATLLAHGGPR